MEPPTELSFLELCDRIYHLEMGLLFLFNVCRIIRSVSSNYVVNLVKMLASQIQFMITACQFPLDVFYATDTYAC